MAPADVALLVVLGTADGDPTSLAEITAVARLLAPYDWQRTGDGLRVAVERAIEEGLIVPMGDGSGSIVKTTRLGRTRIRELLCASLPRASGGFMRGCMGIKLCFLHHLPLPERGYHVQELARLHQDALAPLRQLARMPRSLAGPALTDVRHEIARLESELAWLDGMMAWQPHQHAAE